MTSNMSSDSVRFGLHLVRHGETDANRQRLCESKTPTPLNSVGRQQAQALGGLWRQEGVTFTHVYSSDIVRVLETCRIALSAATIDTDSNQLEGMSIVEEPLLRERALGCLNGWDYDRAVEALRQAELQGKVLPGVEPRSEMSARADMFFGKICSEMCDKAKNTDVSAANGVKHVGDVVAFSHGGLIHTLLKHMQQNNSLDVGRWLLPGRTELHASPNTGYTHLIVNCETTAETTSATVQCCHLYSERHLTQDLMVDYYMTSDGTKIPK